MVTGVPGARICEMKMCRQIQAFSEVTQVEISKNENAETELGVQKFYQGVTLTKRKRGEMCDSAGRDVTHDADLTKPLPAQRGFPEQKLLIRVPVPWEQLGASVVGQGLMGQLEAVS